MQQREKRCPTCGVIFSEGDLVCPQCGHIASTGRSRIIQVQGHNALEVQEVSLALMKQHEASLRAHSSPWASGLFYLVVFVVIVVALAVIGHILPFYMLPMIVMGGLLTLATIGAFQLRQDGRLSEENFLKLMALSFRYIPWLQRKAPVANQHTSQEETSEI